MEQVETKKTAQDLLQQGHELRKEGKFNDAIAAYGEGIQLDANSYQCYHFLGETLAQKNQLDAAIEAYKQAIRINPKYPWSYHCLGQALLWRGKIEQAISASEQAVKLKPDEGEFYYQLGQCLEQKEDREKAIRIYQEAINLNPLVSDTVYSRLTTLMLEENQIDVACDICKIALEKCPESSKLYFNYGRVQAAQGLGQDAIKSYEKAIELDSSNWEAYQNLGDILLILNKLQEANQAYQNAETKFFLLQEFNQSDIPNDFDWEVYLTLNSDLKITGKFDAIAHFMRYGLGENKLYALKHLHDRKKRPDIADQSWLKEIRNDSLPATKLAVLAHIYYCDLWTELSSRIKNIESEFDLFINIVIDTWLPEMHQKIRADFPQAKILISANRGRDIGGHFSLMSHIDFSKYDCLCLLHTKRSPHISPMISDIWRQDLLDALLGTKEKVKQNLTIMSQYPEIGLIGSRYWRSTAIANNQKNYEALLDKFKIQPTARNCEYLSGTMMLIRSQIMQEIYEKLRNIELESEGEKNISFQTDGQMAHAIERIIGNVVRDRGLNFFWQE